MHHCQYAAVVLVGPSHFVGFQGVSIWPRGAWDTPLGAVKIDDRLAGVLMAESRDVFEHPAAHGREHSLEMQLPFVAKLLPGVPIVPLVMGYQRRETATALGDALARAIGSYRTRDKSGVLLVASSDLSHYEDAATASRLDACVARYVETLDADGLMGCAGAGAASCVRRRTDGLGAARGGAARRHSRPCAAIRGLGRRVGRQVVGCGIYGGGGLVT